MLKRIAALVALVLLTSLLSVTTHSPAQAAQATTYALVKSKTSDQYWVATVNLSTGARTNVITLDTSSIPGGTTFSDLRAAGYSAVTQKMYAFDYATQKLFSITMNNGRVELAGSLTPRPSGVRISAIAINSSGEAFAFSEKNLLYRVVLESGALYNPQPVDELPGTTRSINSMTFYQDQLYVYAEVSAEYTDGAPTIGRTMRWTWRENVGRFRVSFHQYSQKDRIEASIPSLGIYATAADKPSNVNLYRTFLNSAGTLLTSEAINGFRYSNYTSRGVMSDNSTYLIRGLYQLNPMSLSFDSQGGTAVDTVFGTEGQQLNEPPPPTQSGADFEGWFTQPVGGSKVSWPYTLSSSTTLYARWNSTPATLSFDSHGGSPVSAIQGFVGQEIAEPTDPTRDNFGFDGWYTQASGGTQVGWPYTLTSDTTLHAVWSATLATLTFDSQGGSSVSPIASYSGVEIDKPSDPTQSGKVFQGWWTDPTAGSEVSWPYTLSSNITLYARWADQPATLSFDSQGGSPVTDIVSTVGASLTQPSAPLFPLRTFKGWFTQASGGSLITWPYTLTQNTTVYAQWESITSTITFDSHGGTAVSSIPSTLGEHIDEPAEPTRANVAFEGWFTSEIGGQKIDWPHYLTEINPTLHAQWNTIPATLSFDSLGGTPVSSMNSFVGEELEKPITPPTKTDRTFIGWFESPTSGEEVLWPYELLGDTTLYARWAINATITFDSQGGTSLEPISGLEGDLVNEPSTPTRDGFTFAGWVTRNSPESQVRWPFSLTQNVTMYATWRSGEELAATGLSQNLNSYSFLGALAGIGAGWMLLLLRRRKSE